jgi:hypothetical protein
MRNNVHFKFLRTLSPGKILAGFCLAAMVYQTQATPVTVQEMGVGPNEVVEMTSSTLGTHWVYAGMLNLSVDSVAVDGFCIDPFHWSASGPQAYDTESLALAPKAPVGGMGIAEALQIEQLWKQYYSHNMSNQDAAGLQIAIWEITGGVNFHLDSALDYGAGAMLTWVNNNPNAAAADLIALTGPGQDYVIPNSPEVPHIPNVPDGGQTALMLGCGLIGLAVMRSKFLKARAPGTH